jgi:alkylation response protein AidB-like acyl-CoA dehydrogenase
VALQASRSAVQLHGTIGYTQPFNALSPLIGSTSAMIYGGTNEIQRNILARPMLGL